MKNSQQKRSAGGRPPKFDEPSRPVTLTLPDSTLEGLKLIDTDRSLAIVKVTQAALNGGATSRPPVEIVEMSEGTGLLIIGPCPVLRKISFLHLVEVAPARYLLALNPGNDFKSLEIAIRDVLDELPSESDRERELIIQLLEKIRIIRKSERVSMAEILFVNLGGE